VTDRIQPQVFTRRHGPISAQVLQLGSDDFTALAIRKSETRPGTRHIKTLEAAQRVADDAAQALWRHDCATEGCGGWSAEVGADRKPR
jgi:hypothetical protein